MRDNERYPEPPPKPAGRIAMLLAGLLAGMVIATAVGVVLLGMRIATVGDAAEVIEAPETTSSPTETATDTTTEPSTETATGTSTGTSGDTTTSDGGVPDPCVRSAEYNIAVDESLDELAAGARDEDARTVQEVLDDIQTARDEADGAAEECLELAGSGR